MTARRCSNTQEKRPPILRLWHKRAELLNSTSAPRQGPQQTLPAGLEDDLAQVHKAQAVWREGRRESLAFFEHVSRGT